jgi:hypothetical protein
MKNSKRKVIISVGLSTLQTWPSKGRQKKIDQEHRTGSTVHTF